MATLAAALLVVAACSDDDPSRTDPGGDVADAGGDLGGDGGADDTGVDDADSDAEPADGDADDASETGDDVADTADPDAADPDSADPDSADPDSADPDADALDATDADADDADAEEVCPIPARRIGEGEGAVFLEDASSCGQDAFVWIDDDRLGEITRTGSRARFSAALLETTLASFDVGVELDFVYDAAVWPVTYVTQDRGELIEATGLIALPTNYDPTDGPLPILIGLHGTSGFTDGCGVSGELEWRALMSVFASFGYAVVAPDYIGLREDGETTGFLHPYLVPQPTALASLDMARALQRHVGELQPGLCVGSDVMLFGGSQGGHAVLWVDRMQPWYAAEFELLGAAATVAPADIVAQVASALEEVRNSTANTLAKLGTAWEWYGLDLSEVLREPWDVDVPAALRAECNPSGELDIDDVALTDIFQPELLDAAADGTLGDFGEWGCILRESSLLETRVPRRSEDPESYGIFLALGGNDNLVDTPIERLAYERLCEADLPVEMVECEGASHGGTTFEVLTLLLDFFDARRAGEPFVRPETCDAPPAIVCQSPTK